MTHFCAPAFIFLAGTSIFLYSRRHAGLSRFLIVRGVWLIFLEFTFLRVAWTFNFDFRHYEMAGVIWVIGCCMILMAGLVKLPLPVVGTIGVVIIAAHNLMDSHMGKLLEGLDGNRAFGPLEDCVRWVLRRSDSVWLRMVPTSSCFTRSSRGSGSWPRVTRSARF